MNKLISVFCVFLFLISCSGDSSGDVLLPSEVLNVPGTRYSASKTSFNTTYSSLNNVLAEDERINEIIEVDLAANARSLGRVLHPLKVVLFQNPELDSNLLQRNQLAGLDLPHKILVYQNSDDVVYALYNSVAYLVSRYNLQETENLDQISETLEGLATSATSAEVKRASNITVEAEEGIITKVSNLNFEETYSNLVNAISLNENFKVIGEIDHQTNASDVGVNLSPTKLILLENIVLETSLVQSSQTLALDLPLKILVWEDEGGMVKISYNNPFYLEERHSITNHQTELEQLLVALDEFSSVAAAAN
ncbi:DUF302 domain-containing protein [Gillisia sp. M10.2A]|uniref:DUF302 domain-containing protein n=1 Tax=Gillisia lutea TaxID=2909668 RepID=A0ABS9EJB8_9FLAO|nr:DUF302 domain-containing protein [Gillisia lutea]MCF4101969.1 DUF302 domain-containing protein [Gillisia lutea]